MAKVLYIESSPRKQRSKSIAIARAFLDEYKKLHPTDEVVEMDLWKKAIPEFDGFTIDAKYQVMHGQSFSPEQKNAWQAVVDLCDEFKAADKYVISLPMWNFGIPYKLKHYFDVIAQPGQTFTVTNEGKYQGLVTGKPVVGIYARGGAYGSDGNNQVDYQISYLKLLLGFVGFTQIESLVIEPTLGDPETVKANEVKVIGYAKELAARF